MDADLDVSVALALLLAVGMDMVIRFREYSQWPYLAYTLSSKYNPDGYISACVDFLNIPDEQLDVGVGLPLRSLANRAGSTDTQRFQYLISHSVQAALVLAFEPSVASSLPAERAFAATKRNEAPTTSPRRVGARFFGSICASASIFSRAPRRPPQPCA